MKKILLILMIALSLTSCESVQDFMYENMSLQKNIDQAAENSRKNIEGDFKLDDFGYVFPPAVGRFIENGFSYKASIEGEAYVENEPMIPAGKIADIFLTKDDNTIFVKAKNDTSSPIDVADADIGYIEISAFELEDMSFSVHGIEFGDALYEMEAKLPDRDFIELRQNTKDLQNDQYYIYLNGQYVAVFTLYQGKLSQVEIIPNERLIDYE